MQRAVLWSVLTIGIALFLFATVLSYWRIEVATTTSNYRVMVLGTGLHCTVNSDPADPWRADAGIDVDYGIDLYDQFAFVVFPRYVSTVSYMGPRKTVTIPLWWIPIVTLLLAVRSGVGYDRRRGNVCEHCRYALDGVGSVCPECGTPVPTASPKSVA